MKVRRWSIVACFVLLSPAAVLTQVSKSSAPARALTGLMTVAHLDAIAVRDSIEPDRFVAALFYPGSQLLVVSARYGAPASLQGLLDRKDYKQVYSALSATPDMSSQVLFQDLNADGLAEGRGDVVDILYEKGTQQTIFDDAWRKQHKIDDAAYADKYRVADELYAHLLSALANVLTSPAAGGK